MVSEELKDKTVCVVGLGYVGQPLAEAFSSHLRTIGFDIVTEKVNRINGSNGGKLLCTADPAAIKQADFVLICVPTPITKHKEPDLAPVKSAAEVVGRNLKSGGIVVLESTVYPGVTEEIVVPILEQQSGMICGRDFKVGYSPERVNPGDDAHSIDKITKIVSGMDEESTRLLAELYGLITHVFVARDIKTAEAAKVIENIQRDINIALMNELSMIFDKMGIDTTEVLKAAGTKWNFLPFRPGLVGGHCIGVDPYYLTFKAESLGYRPEMILAGRRINDRMAKFIAERTVKILINSSKQVRDSRVAIMGLTFKENVPDLRNTKVVDIISELKTYNVNVVVHDPIADPDEAKAYYGIDLQPLECLGRVDAVIVAVVHDAYKSMGLSRIAKLCYDGCPIVIDIKGAFDLDDARNEQIRYWRL